MKTKTNKFHAQCEAIAETIDCRLYFYTCDHRRTEAFHDDGVLHVSKRGVRAAFTVDQDQDFPELSNSRTRRILAELGLKSLINDKTLVDETDEDDACPHCGRSGGC